MDMSARMGLATGHQFNAENVVFQMVRAKNIKKVAPIDTMFLNGSQKCAISVCIYAFLPDCLAKNSKKRFWKMNKNVLNNSGTY